MSRKTCPGVERDTTPASRPNATLTSNPRDKPRRTRPRPSRARARTQSRLISTPYLRSGCLVSRSRWHEEIAERAYFIHLEQGSSDELANWLRAVEHNLIEQPVAGLLNPGALGHLN